MAGVTMRADTIQLLRLFNQHADRLLRLSFFEKTRGGGAILDWNRGGGWEQVFVGPDEEAFEAFMLTLRLFMQDNDRISLRKLRKALEGDPGAAGLLTEVSEHCAALNEFLDMNTEMGITEGELLTFREILNIFVYGGYAHLDPKYRPTYEAIRSGAFYPMFQVYLVHVLKTFSKCVRSIRDANVTALEAAA
jgi:hypothetical protein